MRNHQNTKAGKFAKSRTSAEKVKQTLKNLKSSKDTSKSSKSKDSNVDLKIKTSKNLKSKAEAASKGKSVSKGTQGAAMNSNASHLSKHDHNSVSKPALKTPRAPSRSSYTSSIAICREEGCDLPMSTLRYCRLHYIKNWKRIKKKESILKEKRLDIYIEELVSKYPDKYIETIRVDLASEKEFAKVVGELEFEDTSAATEDFESETDTGGVEEIIDTAKRSEFDDDDDFGFG